MKSSHNLLIDDERAVEQFAQSMIENSVKIFHAMQELQNQVQQHDVIILSLFIVFNSSIYIELNSQSLTMIAQIITQILNNQSFLVIHLFANSVAVFITFKFKKLFDIFEYECYDPSYAPMLVAMLVAMLMTIAGRSPLGYRVVPRPTLFRVSLCSSESYR